MNNLPKSYLVRTILSKGNHDHIRSSFGIKGDTAIEDRLNAFSKVKLIEYIENVGGSLKSSAEAGIELFPLKSAPTIYIINITSDIDFQNIQQISNTLTGRGRDEAVFFENDRAVRCVYIRRELTRIRLSPTVYELVIAYEKRIETTEWNPENSDYGETKFLYSLENALLWFSENKKQYAVLACSDFSAVTPIIKYLNNKFRINASLPDLTEDMLFKIAEGGQIKNATFSNTLRGQDDGIDVRTVTIYDEDLSNRQVYQEMRNQENREQRAGFYSSHPDLLRAGIGITRRYGRVWTPAHLDRDELVKLSLGIVSKLDRQLGIAFRKRLQDFIVYYSNSAVNIGSNSLLGQVRSAYDSIIYYVISAARSHQKRAWISDDYLKDFIRHKDKLKLGVSAIYECVNCGTKNIKCSKCNVNTAVKIENDQIVFKCPRCNQSIDLAEHTCECGSQSPVIDPLSQILMYPQVELLVSIDNYISRLHPAVEKPKLFIINGHEVCILNSYTNENARKISLEELSFWRTRAHLHSYNPISSDRLIRILGLAREKCPINNYHPTRVDCERCLQSLPTMTQLNEGNVCLLRTFGIPIDTEFDGIHHGHEVADIVYSDQINGLNIRIGIHAKSKANSNPRNGLGRSDDKIKELYAQLYYTLYQVSQGQQHFDVLGISIPNRVSDSVLTSMESILIRFGISFIAIDHDCWVKIVGLVKEKIQFNNQ